MLECSRKRTKLENMNCWFLEIPFTLNLCNLSTKGFTISKQTQRSLFAENIYSSTASYPFLYGHYHLLISPPISSIRGEYLLTFFGSVRSSRSHNVVRSSVRSSGSSLSRALNLHHSGSGLSQVSLRSLTQVPLRFLLALILSSLTLLGRTDGA